MRTAARFARCSCRPAPRRSKSPASFTKSGGALTHGAAPSITVPARKSRHVSASSMLAPLAAAVTGSKRTTTGAPSYFQPSRVAKAYSCLTPSSCVSAVTNTIPPRRSVRRAATGIAYRSRPSTSGRPFAAAPWYSSSGLHVP